MCNLFQALYDHGQQLADHQWMEHPAVMCIERIKDQEEQGGRKQMHMNGRKEQVQQEDQMTITEHHLEEKMEVDTDVVKEKEKEERKMGMGCRRKERNRRMRRRREVSLSLFLSLPSFVILSLYLSLQFPLSFSFTHPSHFFLFLPPSLSLSSSFHPSI